MIDISDPDVVISQPNIEVSLTPAFLCSILVVWVPQIRMEAHFRHYDEENKNLYLIIMTEHLIIMT